MAIMLHQIYVYINSTRLHLGLIYAACLQYMNRYILHGLVFLFNGASSFMGNLMPKPTLQKNRSGTV